MSSARKLPPSVRLHRRIYAKCATVGRGQIRTVEEVINEYFDRFNADGSGKLPRIEFVKLLHEGFEVRAPHYEVANLMQLYDTSGVSASTAQPSSVMSSRPREAETVRARRSAPSLRPRFRPHSIVGGAGAEWCRCYPGAPSACHRAPPRPSCTGCWRKAASVVATAAATGMTWQHGALTARVHTDFSRY